ncbi:hypothetical protein K435DRAFT_842097 [Dendrothele bispora CBS 962.96]|uniref:Uncharacterized protein n=1 Tax=Dendrothele bispora (strain CBS 962.96) TaxID=1314807 RepID=A0A4S8LI66_DENBC|nr:hypothetical protein K435DRAFT_842097 [Dendrothele bispora CBS 962.96]
MVCIIDGGQRGHPGHHSTTTGFPTLALELIYEIVSYFETMRYPYTSNEVPIPSDVLEAWKALKALSETCKALRVKCRPLLWQNVVCAAGYRHGVDACTSKRGGKMSESSTRIQLEGRIERELDAVTGLLSGKTGIGDLGQYVQFLTITIPPTSSEETIISLAECFSKLTNLQTLQIIGPTGPLVGQIFTTSSSSSSSSPSSSSISNIFAYDHSSSAAFSPTSSPSSSTSSSISTRDRSINLLSNPSRNLKIQPQDRVPVHCPSVKALLLDFTTYEIIPCFPNLVRLYCSFHTFFQRQGSSESLDDSSSLSTLSLRDSSSGEPESEPEPLGLPRHFNVHGQLPSTLSEGVLRRLADIVDAEEEEVGPNSSTGNTRTSGLALPILSELESGLPFPFTLPNSLSPFGATPDPNSNPTNSTLPFTPPPPTPLSRFGANLDPNPTNSTLAFAPPPLPPTPLSMSVPAIMLGTHLNPPNNSTVSFPPPHPLPFQSIAVPPITPLPLESMEPGSSSVVSVPTNPHLIRGGVVPNPPSLPAFHPMDPALLDPINPLDTVRVLNLNLGLVGRDGVGDRDREEERRMREAQWKLVECIREGTSGWSLEVFEIGGPGVEEDREMWAVEEGGGEEGRPDGREDREGRDEEGDGVEEEREKNMYPLGGSLIRAIVETMPNLRNFPKIHIHPKTPVSLVSYAFYSLPYLSSFHINPSEPLDPRTIEFIAACTSIIGEVAAENAGIASGSGSESTPMILGASASTSMTVGSRNTSSMGNRKKNVEFRMQMRDWEFVLPI